MKNQDSKLTPLMRQYWDIKAAHMDKILLFRMGDFYEMFHDDAIEAAPLIGIALTCRNKKSQDETPLCGVPHHSVAGPINKLLAYGKKVAICDQIEDPKFAKGIVKRAVTRILSPGMVYDPETLDHTRPNYLCSLDRQCISFLETTTGEAFYYRVQNESARRRLLQVLAPKEIVIGEGEREAFLNSSMAGDLCLSQHELNQDIFFEKQPALPVSARRLLSYAVYMQGPEIQSTMNAFEERELSGRLELSPTVVRHLELFATYKGEERGSLFFAINRTRTSAGARLLKQWLAFPLRELDKILSRQERVTHWIKDLGRLKNLRSLFSQMGDIERRLGKISNPGCNPRDLVALADSIDCGLQLATHAKEEQWDEQQLSQAIFLLNRVRQIIVDDPPLATRMGNMIKPGVSKELDELINLTTNSQSALRDMEMRERELTGISSLKIRYNNVFGYYIEITHTHKDKVPDRYQRKQTLANAERYFTPELEELERKVLSASTRRCEVEFEIFSALRSDILNLAPILLGLARRWSELDVITSLAHLALEQNYVRPSFTEERGLHLIASRHPVVEQEVKHPFVPNNINLDSHSCLLLTGPNMAGKSTLMRQVAVTVIMAQMGSFVPAEEARISLFDRVFTRIGASDFLSEGLSTFMVEMQETAEMLAEATSKSLVILDEVGRGTSTFDGMSLAHAILEYLLGHCRCTTLFATHYHELTDLGALYPQIVNMHMSVSEKRNDITFLHTLVPGPANRSYGIQVAQLAGLPTSVTRRARTILENIEDGQSAKSGQLSLLNFTEVSSEVSEPVESFPSEYEEIINQIKALSLSNLTPLEALNQMAKWQQDLS